MDSRTAAHVLSKIAAYLELQGENPFKCRAYAGAAAGLRALAADDLAPMYRSGELGKVPGLGPATLAVIRDLVDTGESRYLEQLRASTPEGLVAMLDISGMTPARIQQVYEKLNIETIEDLAAAAADGRLATLPRLGPMTAARILAGIAMARERASLRLYHHAVVDAERILASVRGHPGVARAEIAGAIRRRLEIVASVEIVAACRQDPASVAQSFGRLPGVRAAEEHSVEARTGEESSAAITIHFVDGTRLELRCVTAGQFGVALWSATGTDEHVAQVTTLLAAKGFTIENDALHDPQGRLVIASDEALVYRSAGLAFVEPELREGRGEVDAAARHALPALLVRSDIRGVLHCHSQYSDGRATLADMARAARDRGWSYIGITDHSQAAAYAGGLSREKVLAQHGEIDELNSTYTDFRILKGIEADILADGQLDYGDDLLDRFDFVIGSIHSRLSVDQATMTARVLRALDDPRLTILGHPTGRLLLSREPSPIDLEAVCQKAAEGGAAVELNADPHRLDLDWRHLQRAKALGATIAIGPDAHSTRALDMMDVGVGIARKGWLEPRDVLNTREADGVLAFARARRDAHHADPRVDRREGH